LHALGLAHDFCIGTEGFDLICEMVATHDPQWVEWNEMCRARFEKGIEWLRQIEAGNGDLSFQG